MSVGLSVETAGRPRRLSGGGGASRRRRGLDRAILGPPVPEVTVDRPGASAALVADEPLDRPAVTGVEEALATPETDLRPFGKLDAYADRRMGVTVATADDTARGRATAVVDRLEVGDDA